MILSTLEKFVRFLVPPRIPFRGSRDLDTIQRQRKICWIIFALSGLCYLTIWILFVGKFVKPSKNIFIAIVSLVCSTFLSRVIFFSARYFLELRDTFFSIRLKELAERLSALEKQTWVYTVSMRSFMFYPNLEQLEDFLSARFLERIKKVRTDKLQQQNLRDRERLQQAHGALDREILENAERLGKSYKIRRKLRKDLSLSSKRGLLADLVGFAMLGGQALHDPDREEARLAKLIGILANLVDGEFCDKAKSLHDAAKQATSFKEKERLLSAAIEAQRTFRRAAVASPEVEVSADPKEVLPTQYIRLWDRAREMFSVDELLPPDMDAEMAKAILLVLIDPGSRERVFQEKYRPADRLKRDVARYYSRIGIPFRPECFDRTVSRLHADGVLFSKPKTDERMYSLTSQPAKGKSIQAQALIRKVVETASMLKK